MRNVNKSYYRILFVQDIVTYAFKNKYILIYLVYWYHEKLNIILKRSRVLQIKSFDLTKPVYQTNYNLQNFNIDWSNLHVCVRRISFTSQLICMYSLNPGSNYIDTFNHIHKCINYTSLFIYMYIHTNY